MIDKAPTSAYLRAMARPALSCPLVLFALVLIFSLVPGQNPAQAGSVEEVNWGRGGETLELNTLPVFGRTTLVDFYSPFCPPCVQVAPLLEELGQRRADLVIKKININRPQVQGIDWKSPLAQQHQIRSVPHFLIFNPQGKLVARGQTAMNQVISWLREAGILRK